VPESPLPHVVVLDGSPLFAELYYNLLVEEGYRVTPLTGRATDPKAVLGLRPDLVVLDLRCGGGMGGLEFLRRLRAEPAGRDLPVLASTPAALLDLARYGEELRALGAAPFDGFAVIDGLLDAARAVTAQVRESRRSGAARARLRAARGDDPPVPDRGTPPMPS
jgi:CheY-like chemotaxis protein